MPIESPCWVVRGRFLAGEFPGAEDEATAREKVAKLTDAGVAAFIAMTGEEDRLEPYAAWPGSVEHLHFSIRDLGIPSFLRQTSAAPDAVDERMEPGTGLSVGAAQDAQALAGGSPDAAAVGAPGAGTACRIVENLPAIEAKIGNARNTGAEGLCSRLARMMTA